MANDKLKNDFDMSNIHMIMMDKNMDCKEKQKMLNEIDQVDGVKWTYQHEFPDRSYHTGFYDP